MRLIIPFFLLMWIVQNGFGQQYSVSGVVVDDLNHLPLANAAVTLARTQDSILVTFGRTDAGGRFQLKGLQEGKYDVFISLPDYIGVAMDLMFSPGVTNHQMDSIALIKNSQMLDELVIVDGSKIKFKGDTIQFIADSFQVGANANVEDLLKKIAGLSVNSKGEITAFGEKVEKVYVDGEEFFGDDPTIATRNIQAKAIDKVQVFDKTSQMEELTGVADDEKFKAINLTLKDEYKKGHFGKVSAGMGYDPAYYDGSLMWQGYTKNSKFSIYGIGSNTGATGLNFDDLNRYGGAFMNTNFSSDGDMMITISSDDDISWDGRYNGQGLPRSLAGGASYSTKLLKDKMKINANYGYADQQLSKISAVNSANFLPTDTYLSRQDETMSSQRKNHSVKFALEYEVDSFTTIKYMGSGSQRNNQGEKSIHSVNSGINQDIRTDIARDLTSTNEVMSMNNQLSLTRKFKKERRLLLLNATYNVADDGGDRDLRSYNQYFLESRSETIDQRQMSDRRSRNLNTRLSFSEPLSEKWTAQVNYYYSKNKNLSSLATYQWDEGSNDYSFFVDSLSNDFDYQIQTNGGGATLAFKKEKFNYNFGTQVEYADYTLVDKATSEQLDNPVFRWLPQASFNYRFNRTSGLRFNYRGSTIQPTLSQIQPVRDNSDPLYQVKGNPDLLQGYRQNFNLSYNMWRSLADESIWTNLQFSNTFNQIVPNNYIDESGKNISTFTNAHGGYFGNWYGQYNKRLTKLFSFGLGMNATLTKNISYINNFESAVRGLTWSPSLSLEMELDEILDFTISYAPSFSKYTGGLVQGAGNTNGHGVNGNFRWEITKSLEFVSEAIWDYQPAQRTYDEDFSQTIWNAELQLTVDKAKTIVLRCAVQDILNENKGYRRYVSPNLTNESTYNTIRRYGFLGITYHIKNKV